MEHQASQQAFENGFDGLELGLNDDLVEQDKVRLFVITLLLELFQDCRQVLDHFFFCGFLI
jgi:hypothetical protein